MQAFQQDRSLVDRLVYLASLASVREDVNPMLDTLRVVTASSPVDQPFRPQDRQSLLQLEDKLKDYLLHKDPLRSFTVATLEQRLDTQKTGGLFGLSRLKGSLLAAIAFIFLVSVLPLAIPPYTNVLYKLTFLSAPLFFMALDFATSWFYLTALINFRPELRRAFALLCAGIIFLGVTFSSYAVIEAFHLDSLPPLRYSGPDWLIVVSFVCIYAGLRIYARLLQIKTHFTSLRLAAGITILSIALGVLMPHSPQVRYEAFFDLSLSSILVFASFAALGAGIARAIMRRVTDAYANPLRLLFLYLALGSIASLVSAGALIYIGEIYGSTLNVVLVACGVIPQVLLLYTGYSFKKETSQ